MSRRTRSHVKTRILPDPGGPTSMRRPLPIVCSPRQSVTYLRQNWRTCTIVKQSRLQRRDSHKPVFTEPGVGQ